MMRPQNFDWQETDQRGLSVKALGSFTERRIEISLLKLAPGARAKVAPRPGRQVGFRDQWRRPRGRRATFACTRLSCWTRARAPTVRSKDGMEILLIGLPIFASQAAPSATPPRRHAAIA